MADETPQTVKVKALQHHTAFGKAYAPGDTYDIDAQFVESVVAQGKAARVDTPAPPPAKPSQPVEPMTTENTGIVAPKPKK